MVKKRSYATAAGNKDDDELHDDNDNGDQLQRCSGCPKTFSTSKGLNNHLSQSHTCKHAIINALVEKQSMYLGSTVTGKSTVEGTLLTTRMLGKTHLLLTKTVINNKKYRFRRIYIHLKMKIKRMLMHLKTTLRLRLNLILKKKVTVKISTMIMCP